MHEYTKADYESKHVQFQEKIYVINHNYLGLHQFFFYVSSVSDPKWIFSYVVYLKKKQQQQFGIEIKYASGIWVYIFVLIMSKLILTKCIEKYNQPIKITNLLSYLKKGG